MDKLKQSFEIIVNEIERLDGRIDSLSGGGIGGVPRGIITMWSGAIADIPSGWALCDGSNGTPDLRDRFIVGAGGDYNVGNTGGADRVTLEISHMPSHGHTGSTSSAGSHTHDASPYVRWSQYRYFIGSDDALMTTYQPDTTAPGEGTGFSTSHCTIHTLDLNIESAGSHSHSVSIGLMGGDQPHENRPPYYALAYIMKL